MSRCSLFEHVEHMSLRWAPTRNHCGCLESRLRPFDVFNIWKKRIRIQELLYGLLCIWSAFRVRWELAVEYILDGLEILDPMTASSSMRAYVMVIWPFSRLQDA